LACGLDHSFCGTAIGHQGRTTTLSAFSRIGLGIAGK
jgi:hypothetical protein